MKHMEYANVALPQYTAKVDVLLWEHGDPVPQFSPEVGIDTETELFTDTMLHPPVVVLGCFDPVNEACYIVYWKDIPEFMLLMHNAGITQMYFNIGYDEGVIDNCDEAKTLMRTIDEDRARDMQVRVHLHELATLGFIRGNVFSLAGCSKAFLGVELDKGEDKGMEADRMTFSRQRPITQSQAKYLCMDCVTTWALSQAVPEMPTETIHTKGMVVLSHISANGFLVDPMVFDALEADLKAARDDARTKLIQYGFPDPYCDQEAEAAAVSAQFMSEYARAVSWYGGTPELEKPPSKDGLRLMLTQLYNYSGNQEDMQSLPAVIKQAAEGGKLKAAEKKLYKEFVETYDLDAFDQANRAIVMLALTGKLLEQFNEQMDNFAELGDGFNVTAAMEPVLEYMDSHPEWLRKEKPIGPRKFFQDYVSGIMEANPQLELSTTEKSGEVQLTKADQWRLDDLGIRDGFLEAYVDFNHYTKYLSTYLNRDMLKSDSRMHPRFIGILRTGRTSCTAPNLQNLPSRDKQFALKNMFCAPDGMILCATDFNFVELVALSQACYSRFGYSTMGDVINAGVDPHRWFAGVRAGLISNDTEFTKDPEKVRAMNALLEEQISKTARQHSKAANFGKMYPLNRFWQTY